MQVVSCDCGIILDYEKLKLLRPEKNSPWLTYAACPCCKKKFQVGIPREIVEDRRE